jgi:glucosamine 6-phosphate synthetase-like amidotransferase/phosphosugar isomerase protein
MVPFWSCMVFHMAEATTTGLWADIREAPLALRRTVDEATGLEETAEMLAGARRIVATGNGAAYYAAMALWLASLTTGDGPEVVALPAGLAFRSHVAPRAGDMLLVISSSGELRDGVEQLRSGRLGAFAAVTAKAGSTLARAAGSRALQHVDNQRSETHSQAFMGSVAVVLALWARLSGDHSLTESLAGAADALEVEIARAPAWVLDSLAEVPEPAAAVAFGSGPGWAAALEAALLLKEVARVPAEGVETREGATSAMFGLTTPHHMALSISDCGADGHLAEAEALCAKAGGTVLRWSPAQAGDARLQAILAFPALALLAAELAVRCGHDVDRPSWTDAYYATARV